MSTVYKVSTYTIYECGKRTDADGNPHQEDALYPRQGDAGSATRVFVVCDGMGGHEAGEVASDVVSRAVGEYLTRATADGSCTNTMIEEAITHAYNALDAACPDDGNPRKPGTTLTLLVLHSEGFTLAHMGDSRIYLFRPGRDGASTQILHRTRDHSLVNDLVDCGVITPEQARVSPQRNVITRSIQPHEERRLRPAIFNGDNLQPGDCFYLCTDGMLEQITDEQLCEIFSDKVPDTMTRTNMLRQEAVENSDNHSAYIVRIDTVNGVEGRRVDEATLMDTADAEPFEELTARTSPSVSPSVPPAATVRPKTPTVMGRRRPVDIHHRHKPRKPRPDEQPFDSLLDKWGIPLWLLWAAVAAILFLVLILIICLWIA